MFLMNTIKRAIKDLPDAKEPEEEWDAFEDSTNLSSWNYNPALDPGNPACPVNPFYDDDD